MGASACGLRCATPGSASLRTNRRSCSSPLCKPIDRSRGNMVGAGLVWRSASGWWRPWGARWGWTASRAWVGRFWVEGGLETGDAAAAEPAKLDPATVPSRRILLVEDVELNRRLLQ